MSGSSAGSGGADGPTGPGRAAPGEPADVASVGEAGRAAEVAGAGAALLAEVERLRASSVGAAGPADAVAHLAAELDAGRVTAEQAVAALVAGLSPPPGVDGAAVRAMLTDLLAVDPYLGQLAARLGVAGGGETGGPGRDDDDR